MCFFYIIPLEMIGMSMICYLILSDLFQDRPAMQLYQPGARSRSRLCSYEDIAIKSMDQGADKKQESETSNTKEEE